MEDNLKHRDLTDKIIGTFYEVYNELGFGFLESVYEEAMLIALRGKGIQIEQQVKVPVFFRGANIGNFEADLVVENAVIIELKAVSKLVDAHVAQLLNYLRATNIEVGLVLNFGQRPEFKRRAFDNNRKGVVDSTRSLMESIIS